MRFQRCLFLLVLIVVSACSNSGNDKAQVEGDSAPNRQQAAGENIEIPLDLNIASPLDGLAPPEPETRSLPIIDIEGGLAVTIDETLIYAEFDGQEARVLNEDTLVFTVKTLPGGKIAYVGRGSETRNSVFVYDTTTGTMTAEYSLPNGANVISWSDDGEWMTVGIFGQSPTFIARTDGSKRFDTIENGFTSAWLSDNTAVIVLIDTTNGFQPLDVLHYDPETETETTLGVSFEANINSNFLVYAEAQLNALGMFFGEGFDAFDTTARLAETSQRITIRFPEEQSSTAVCDTWGIDRIDVGAETSEAIYEVEDTHGLSNLEVLPDGSVLVIRWYKAECQFSNPLIGELLKINEEGMVQEITDDLLVDSTQFNGEQRYTVSPDGRYVVWISRDASGAAALDMMDLAAGRTARLAELTSSSYFHTITWVGS